MTRAPGALAARLLAAAILVLIGLAAWRDQASRVADKLRRDEPVTGLISLRFEGQGRVVPPALYFAVYGASARSLDLVYIPPTTPLPAAGGDRRRTLAASYGAALVATNDVRDAGQAMGREALGLLSADPLWPKVHSGRAAPPDFWISMELPPDMQPAFTQELKDRLAAKLAGPLFWIRFLSEAWKLRRHSVRPIGRYEVLLMARQLRRLSREEIHISRMPSPELLRPFLGGVFGRAAGLPEPSGAVTVEVLNAAGARGVAMRATKVLRCEQFDVVHFGNALMRESRTRVVDRTGRLGTAQAVAEALGCPEPAVVTEMDRKSPHISVSVFIGRDYRRCSGLRDRHGRSDACSGRE